MIILGIDPGYQRLGIAIIHSEKGQKDQLIHSSCFQTEKNTPDIRLNLISTELRQIITEYKPEVLAIEKLFWGKNKKTALGVAEARGVIINEAASRKIPVVEYSPAEIKIAITGYGASKKEHIIRMLSFLIEISGSSEKKLDDEYDAIAVALTHSSSRHYPK